MLLFQRTGLVEETSADDGRHSNQSQFGRRLLQPSFPLIRALVAFSAKSPGKSADSTRAPYLGKVQSRGDVIAGKVFEGYARDE